MQQIKLKKRAWIFRYLRNKIGLDAHAFEFYQSQNKTRAMIEDIVTLCEECEQPVKINQPFEWVGKERVVHQECTENYFSPPTK